MEKWFRENVKSHSIFIRVAARFQLDPSYAQNLCTNVLLHWVLDKIIMDSSTAHKAENIKCIGEKMGLVYHLKASSMGDDVKRYKVRGLDDPRGDLAEFMKSYHEKLAHFINHKWAEIPQEGEGIDIDLLERLLGTSKPQYMSPIPPTVPKEIPVVAGAGFQKDPSKGTKTKRVVDQEIANLRGEMESMSAKVGITNQRLDGHEGRISMLEMEVRKMKEKL